MIIAIDGPAGAGKTTVGLLLAEKLGVVFISSGSIYRCLALKCIFNGVIISEKSVKQVEHFAQNLDLKFQVKRNEGNGQIALCVLLDGVDVTSRIASVEVSSLTAVLAQYDTIRMEVRKLQKHLSYPSAVVEGRDIGTVVFPEAFLKFYLSASSEARATRRAMEIDGNLDRVQIIQTEILARDQMDMNRVSSPHKKADDAIAIDTTNLSPVDVVAILYDAINSKLAELAILK